MSLYGLTFSDRHPSWALVLAVIAVCACLIGLGILVALIAHLAGA